MLKTCMSDYEKSSAVTYPFYFTNGQSIHNTNCMQRIKKILMREVFPAIALEHPHKQNPSHGLCDQNNNLIIRYSNIKLNYIDANFSNMQTYFGCVRLKFK